MLLGLLGQGILTRATATPAKQRANQQARDKMVGMKKALGLHSLWLNSQLSPCLHIPHNLPLMPRSPSSTPDTQFLLFLRHPPTSTLRLLTSLLPTVTPKVHRPM